MTSRSPTKFKKLPQLGRCPESGEILANLTDPTPLLSGLRVTLSEIVEFFKAQANELREQHGGVQKHGTIEELMIKIGNCVDRTALKLLEEQVFAIHAEQLATANSNGVKYLEECISLIDRALALSSD